MPHMYASRVGKPNCSLFTGSTLFVGVLRANLKASFQGSFAAPPSSPPHPISSSLIFPPRKLACWSEIMRLALFTGSWRIYKGSKDVPLIHALCSHWLIMILYLAMLLKNDSRVGTIPIEVNTWDEFSLKGDFLSVTHTMIICIEMNALYFNISAWIRDMSS